MKTVEKRKKIMTVITSLRLSTTQMCTKMNLGSTTSAKRLATTKTLLGTI